jgi:peptidoglycan/xylan/chitin deacetylase (PgdA/CDA1 family)
MVHRTPFILPLLYSSLTWRMQPDKQTLYLTFDDGPVPGPTEFVVDTLKRAGIKATFFCIGDNIRKNPEIFRRVLDNGHAIGNHTFNHLDGWKTSTNEYEANVSTCANEIDAHAGAGYSSRNALFRPPFGRISRNQIKRLIPDYRIIMWDVLSVDYNHRLPAEKCLKHTIAAARGGSIVVFHDSYKAEKNLTYALPRFVDHFMEKGFTFHAIAGGGVR